MSNSNIATMTDRQLRNEVQLLRDEIAIMRRKYEDILYNLDTDNFSSRFVKEQGDMRTAIKVTAEGIETKVSKDELGAFEESILSQTSSEIKATVKKEIDDGNYVTQTDLSLTADDIRATVLDSYESLQSEIGVTAEGISTRVGSLENGEFKGYTLFTQDSNKFTFYGNYMDIQSAIRLTDNYGNHAFSIFHQESNGNVYMWGAGEYTYSPVIIGNASAGSAKQPIYLYDQTDDNLVATRGWVNNNAKPVAVFG